MSVSQSKYSVYKQQQKNAKEASKMVLQVKMVSFQPGNLKSISVTLRLEGKRKERTDHSSYSLITIPLVPGTHKPTQTKYKWSNTLIKKCNWKEKLKFLNLLKKLYVYRCFACMHSCLWIMCAPGYLRGQNRLQVSWDWSYRQLWASM